VNSVGAIGSAQLLVRVDPSCRIAKAGNKGKPRKVSLQGLQIPLSKIAENLPVDAKLLLQRTLLESLRCSDFGTSSREIAKKEPEWVTLRGKEGPHEQTIRDPGRFFLCQCNRTFPEVLGQLWWFGLANLSNMHRDRWCPYAAPDAEATACDGSHAGWRSDAASNPKTTDGGFKGDGRSPNATPDAKASSGGNGWHAGRRSDAATDAEATTIGTDYLIMPD